MCSLNSQNTDFCCCCCCYALVGGQGVEKCKSGYLEWKNSSNVPGAHLWGFFITNTSFLDIKNLSNRLPTYFSSIEKHESQMERFKLRYLNKSSKVVFKSPFIILCFSGGKRKQTPNQQKQSIQSCCNNSVEIFLLRNKITLFGKAYCLLICFGWIDEWPSNYEIVLQINSLSVQTFLLRVITWPWWHLQSTKECTGDE